MYFRLVCQIRIIIISIIIDYYYYYYYYDVILDKCPQLAIYVWHLNKVLMSYDIVIKLIKISKWQFVLLKWLIANVACSIVTSKINTMTGTEDFGD